MHSYPGLAIIVKTRDRDLRHYTHGAELEGDILPD
jgi:hypothetical protein